MIRLSDTHVQMEDSDYTPTPALLIKKHAVVRWAKPIPYSRRRPTMSDYHYGIVMAVSPTLTHRDTVIIWVSTPEGRMTVCLWNSNTALEVCLPVVF